MPCYPSLRTWTNCLTVSSICRYYIFKGTKLVKGPDYIADGFQGLPKDLKKIDAAFVWPGNNQLYIFRDQQYWRFQKNPGTNVYRLDYGYPRLITSAWRKVPAYINSVFAWKNGKTYFFKGDKYYRLNDRIVQVASGYPRSVTQDWSSCPAGLRGSVSGSAQRLSFSGIRTLVLLLISYLYVSLNAWTKTAFLLDRIRLVRIDFWCARGLKQPT